TSHDPVTTSAYTPSLHDALPISANVNVREKPEITSSILAQVKKNESYPMITSTEEWVQIQLGNGTKGWVAKWLVTLQQPSLTYRSEEHTSELQSRFDLVCRLLLE